jgi:hypothetical protein
MSRPKIDDTHVRFVPVNSQGTEIAIVGDYHAACSHCVPNNLDIARPRKTLLMHAAHISTRR